MFLLLEKSRILADSGLLLNEKLFAGRGNKPVI